MKKITFLFMLLCSITAFSQIEIVENFDALSNNQVPAGWTYTSNFRASSQNACGASGLSARVGLLQGDSGTLTTPNYPAISNGTDVTVSFSVNVFEQTSQFPPSSLVAPAANWGSVVLEYSTDGGTTWTAGYTINDSNFTFVDPTTCMATGSVNIGSIASGSDFQARFNATATTVSTFALWVYVDNLSITQVPTAAPNCDAVLTNPLNGSSDADLNTVLTWSAATGIPDGYILSVGTTSGGTDIVNAVEVMGTSYSLDGLGLAYNTPYYVNIVPFNDFNNDMTNDLATSCTEETFTTRMQPAVGATCSNPKVVTPLSFYLDSDDTANFENNINSGSCGANDTAYMLGNDVFYQISPATDVSINIELSSISNNGAGMHLMKGCPTDVDKECVAFEGSYSTTGGTLTMTEQTLFAGNTYFLVLSNSSSTRTYSYSLLITQNSCVNPEFTIAEPTGACATNQFNVAVDVTYLGDATSVALTDNFGGSQTGITSTGIVNMGPYTSGSTVNFTLTNEQDNTCTYEGSTYFYCPPSNDECGSAISLPVNTDDTCTLFTSATNAGATDSSATDPTTCGNNTNDVWFSFTANGTTMILEYLNVTAAIGTGGTIQATELLEGSCGSLTSIACNTGNYIEYSGLTSGNIYYIRNKTNLAGEYAQNFDICLKTAPTPPVNDACSSATVLNLSTDSTCDNKAVGTTVGATVSPENNCNTTLDYKDVWYKFTPTTDAYYEFSYNRLQTTPASNYTIYEGSCGSLVQKSGSCNTTTNQIFNLVSGQDYYIMVRSANNGPGIDFELCVWQLPPAAANSDCSTPTTLTESTDMNGNNTISGNLDNAYNSPEGCSSSTYESVWYSFTPSLTGIYNFNFTRTAGSAYYAVFNTDDCSLTTSSGYVAGSCYSSTAISGEVIAGNTYLIMVHASTAASFDLFAYPDPSLGVSLDSEINNFTFYPNPVNNELTLDAQDTITSVSVSNLLGQVVKQVTPNTRKAIINFSELNHGVYFVTIKINNSLKTIKIVKN